MIRRNVHTCCYIFIAIVVLSLYGFALQSELLPLLFPWVVLRKYYVSPVCSHLSEVILYDDPAPIPASSPSAPLKFVLLVHLYHLDYARFVLTTWARSRCFRLRRSNDTRTLGYVQLHLLTFDASPQIECCLRYQLPSAHHLVLPTHYSAIMRTERALLRVATQHPDARWVFKADDDSYVHIGRLVRALLSLGSDHDTPTLWGHVSHLFPHPLTPRFVSGGAGYAISGSALTVVARQLPSTAISTTYRNTPAEDVMVSLCALRAFGEEVMVDEPGLNWGTPESMFAHGSFGLSHAFAPPISHHYIFPWRAAILDTPVYPRKVLQVWAFPSAAPYSNAALWESYFYPPPSYSTASAAQMSNMESCRRAASAEGFEYLLLPARLAGRSSDVLLAFLQPQALERLALLEALHEHGGIAISLDEPCYKHGALNALLQAADAGGREHGGQHASTLDYPEGMALGAETHGAAVAVTSSPKAWASSQFNHGIMRLLTVLAENVTVHLNALSSERKGGLNVQPGTEIKPNFTQAARKTRDFYAVPLNSGILGVNIADVAERIRLPFVKV